MRRYIVTLTTLRLKLSCLLEAVTERKEGGIEVGVADTVAEGEGRGRLLMRDDTTVVANAGPSTTRVVYVETPRLSKSKLPSSCGKKAVPSQSS